MGRYDIDDAEIEEDDQIVDGDYRGFAKNAADLLKRSPIRRKDKWHHEEGDRPKAKRNHKKIKNKIKYDWQGE